MTGEQSGQPSAGPHIENIGDSAMQGAGSPAFGVYRGDVEIENHSLERGFRDFEAHIGMVFPRLRSLDKLIEKRIDLSRRTDNDDVVIVDLGAGVGNFTREALQDPAALRSSRKRLAGRTCATKVVFYSVTDTPDDKSHLSKKPFLEADDPANEQLSAFRVNYSVTSSQTVKKMMQVLGEASADLIVASSFMQYLRPRVFATALQDIVDVLKPGGQFMAFGYGQIAGRYMSLDDGQPEPEGPVEFADFTRPDGAVITGDELRAWGSAILSQTDATPEQLTSAVVSLRETIFSPDFYSQPVLGDFRGAIRNALRARLARGDSPWELFSLLLHTTLPSVEDSERIQQMKAVKDDILDDLAQQNSAAAFIEWKRIPDEAQGLDGMLITKRK